MKSHSHSDKTLRPPEGCKAEADQIQIDLQPWKPVPPSDSLLVLIKQLGPPFAVQVAGHHSCSVLGGFWLMMMGSGSGSGILLLCWLFLRRYAANYCRHYPHKSNQRHSFLLNLILPITLNSHLLSVLNTPSVWNA